MADQVGLHAWIDAALLSGQQPAEYEKELGRAVCGALGGYHRAIMHIQIEAKIVRRGLEAGCLSIQRADAWADRIVMALPQPPVSIINLAVTPYANAQDGAAELAALVPSMARASFLLKTVASMSDALAHEDRCAEAIANLSSSRRQRDLVENKIRQPR